MKKIIVLSSLFLFLIATNSYSLNYKILAVVNGESISSVQVRDRVEFIMKSAGMPNNSTNRARVTKEAIEIIINETLQKQDAAEKNIEASAEEIEAVIYDIEKRNGLKKGGMAAHMKSQGLSYRTMKDQVEASIVWKKILSRYVRPKMEINELDVKKAEAFKPKPVNSAKKVKISEIIIPIEYGKEEQAEALANTIVRTARSGAKNFGDLALKHSAGKTGKKRGALGWVAEKGIVAPIGSVVRKTSAGRVADPIKTDSMYVIVKVHDRQNIVAPAPQMSAQDRATLKTMEAGAKRYMRVMRNKAFISKKYKDSSDLVNLIF